MRFFHQAARRAAVLLLCLSMLTGMLIPAFAATTDPATETPAHNLVCTDNQDENHDPIYKVRLTDDGVGGGCGGGSGETEDGYVVDLIYLKMAFQNMPFSARAYHRILKVARTIADMEATESIHRHHIAEALSYRAFDKKYWN